MITLDLSIGFFKNFDMAFVNNNKHVSVWLKKTYIFSDVLN